MTPTSQPYRSPSAWEEVTRRQKEHDALHWTGCYNDNCWVRDSEKTARGWYPKKSNATQSGWNQPYETKAPAPEDDQPVQISKNQQLKARHSTRDWKECYNNKCPTHIQYKVDAGYYPQKDGTKKELSHWHRYHRDPKFHVGRKGVVGTRQEKEGSKETQPDIEALHRQIRELSDERERSQKKRGRLPTEGSGPASQDRTPSGRRPRTSQDGGRIGIQPRKVEERGGRHEKRKAGARAPEPRAKERIEKSWAEVARFGQLASRDRC